MLTTTQRLVLEALSPLYEGTPVACSAYLQQLARKNLLAQPVNMEEGRVELYDTLHIQNGRVSLTPLGSAQCIWLQTCKDEPCDFEKVRALSPAATRALCNLEKSRSSLPYFGPTTTPKAASWHTVH